MIVWRIGPREYRILGFTATDGEAKRLCEEFEAQQEAADPHAPRVNPPEPPKQVVIRIARIVDGTPVESVDVEVPLERIEDAGRLADHMETRTGAIVSRMVNSQRAAAKLDAPA